MALLISLLTLFSGTRYNFDKLEQSFVFASLSLHPPPAQLSNCVSFFLKFLPCQGHQWQLFHKATLFNKLIYQHHILEVSLPPLNPPNTSDLPFMAKELFAAIRILFVYNVCTIKINLQD